MPFRIRWILAAAAACVLLCVAVFSTTYVHSQTLALLDVHLVDQTGAPLVNQTVIIEGTRQVAKWNWVPFSPKKGERISKIAVTDRNGFVQVVDLPAGDYNLKLVWPGAEPVPAKNFTLEPGYTKRSLGEQKFPVAGATQTNAVTPAPESYDVRGSAQPSLIPDPPPPQTRPLRTR